MSPCDKFQRAKKAIRTISQNRISGTGYKRFFGAQLHHCRHCSGGRLLKRSHLSATHSGRHRYVACRLSLDAQPRFLSHRIAPFKICSLMRHMPSTLPFARDPYRCCNGNGYSGRRRGNRSSSDYRLQPDGRRS